MYGKISLDINCTAKSISAGLDFSDSARVLGRSVCRLEFCSPPAQRSRKQKDVLPDVCYRRLKGLLFFNRQTPISNNKLKILLDERKDLASALEDASTERRLPQDFRAWLEKCHRELDKEVRCLSVHTHQLTCARGRSV